MKDHLGLLVMLVVVILFVGLLVLMRPRRRTRDGVEHETLNPAVESEGGRAPYVPQGPDGDRLVGNPPIDTVDRSGEGTAVPGTGAGGRTTDSYQPLQARPNDVSDSSDQT
ncbi:MAG: hypothetical protein ACKOVB_17085 [Terrabacter sp.]